MKNKEYYTTGSNTKPPIGSTKYTSRTIGHKICNIDDIENLRVPCALCDERSLEKYGSFLF